MANGVSVLYPLVYSKQDGPFQLNKTVEDTVKQNFKNLILTANGERIMDPDFGVGLYSYLFENYSFGTIESLKENTKQQIRKYMPFIEIVDFTVAESPTNLNQFYIYIRYSINSLNVLDELNFTISR